MPCTPRGAVEEGVVPEVRGFVACAAGARQPEVDDDRRYGVNIIRRPLRTAGARLPRTRRRRGRRGEKVKGGQGAFVSTPP